MSEPITVTMTEDEAFTLRLVLDAIGGDYLHSRRKHTQAIVSQLIGQNVPYDDDYAFLAKDSDSGLYFHPEVLD